MAEEEIELIRIWKEFAAKQKDSPNEKFKLNPDMEKVRLLAKGVLDNQKNYGFRYCPCRLTTGRREEDIKLICPCHFKIQKVWKEKGECWCGLFVREQIIRNI